MPFKVKQLSNVANRVVGKSVGVMIGKEPVTHRLEVKTQQIINLLVAKKCDHCQQPMHIHRIDDKITFAGCEPCIVDIKLERKDNDEIIIKGKRSTKAVRCQNCKHRHLLQTFKEVEDGVSKS